MSSVVFHEREQDEEDIERYAKKPKIDAPEPGVVQEDSAPDHILPPSHALLGVPLPVTEEGVAMTFLESNVGISEYVGRGIGKIEGIIKQRYARKTSPLCNTYLPSVNVS